MKTITLLGIAGVAFLSLAQPGWAVPRGGGSSPSGGGHISGGGRVGGFAGGGSRAAPVFHGGGVGGAPTFRGAYFTGRSVGRSSVAPRSYYSRSGMPAVRSRGLSALGNRSITSTGGRISTNSQNRTGSSTGQNTRVLNSQVNRGSQQLNRADSVAGRNRVSDPRTSTAAKRQTVANRQSFVKNHASERHDSNWHRDWDRHHSHFHHNKVFVFIGGFWWGLDPWDYYPYAYDYGYPYDNYGYPSDYNYSYPYDSYSGSYPYDYYQGNNDNDSAYAVPDQAANNPTVSAVQSELAKLGYYNGEIDGTLGDQTEAALARYQDDNNLSVTGTLDAATLRSLGIR
jgi:His-Xaa-Ser repeat protein HxsA